jgi:hypothetical protein
MSVQNIKTAIENTRNGLWATLVAGGSGRRAVGKRFTHITRVYEAPFVKKTVEAINVIAEHMGASARATRTDVSTAYKTVTSNWAGRAINVGEVSATLEHGEFLIRKEEHTGAWSSDKVNRAFREDIYNTWRRALPNPNDAPAHNAPVPGTGRDVTSTMGYGGYVGSGPGEFEGTGLSHDRGQLGLFGVEQESNVANAAFLEWMERQGGSSVLQEVPIGSSTTRVDVASWVMEKLDISWKQVQKPNSNPPIMEWVVTGELAGYNPPPGTEDLCAEWEATLLEKFEKILLSEEFELQDATFKASEPFTNKIATKEMRRIADEYLKAAGFTKGGQKIKVKGIPKKPKKSNRSGSVPPKKGKKSITKKAQRAPKGGATIGGKEYKGGQFLPGNEQGVRFAPDGYVGTAAAMELAKLKLYINSRLPEEVRNNMGRPALIWQTGRFADSVKLLSLQFARDTIMAKYTYLLRPYETFENTGKRRWPIGYNPKPLIAKSIRNLAKGRIQQKLTVRRV